MTLHRFHVSYSSCFPNSIFLSVFSAPGSNFRAFHLLGFLFTLLGEMSVVSACLWEVSPGRTLLTATVILALSAPGTVLCLCRSLPALAPVPTLLQCCRGLCPFSGCWDHCLTETSLGSMSILCRHTSNLNSCLSPTYDVLRHGQRCAVPSGLELSLRRRPLSTVFVCLLHPGPILLSPMLRSPAELRRVA